MTSAADIRLEHPSDWPLWHSLIRSQAKTAGIWEYCDPDSRTTLASATDIAGDEPTAPDRQQVACRLMEKMGWMSESISSKTIYRRANREIPDEIHEQIALEYEYQRGVFADQHTLYRAQAAEQRRLLDAHGTLLRRLVASVDKRYAFLVVTQSDVRGCLELLRQHVVPPTETVHADALGQLQRIVRDGPGNYYRDETYRDDVEDWLDRIAQAAHAYKHAAAYGHQDALPPDDVFSAVLGELGLYATVDWVDAQLIEARHIIKRDRDETLAIAQIKWSFMDRFLRKGGPLIRWD